MSIKRGKDKNGRRYYYRTEQPELRYYSVTTILKLLEEDTTGLDIWKRRNNGKGDSPHHKHLFWYKTYRGTLCHYEALNPLADEELWGSSEREALMEIMEHDEDGPVIYSVLKDHDWVYTRDSFESAWVLRHCSACDRTQPNGWNCTRCGRFTSKRFKASLSDIKDKDVEWFTFAFDKIKDELGITDESIIAVEHFMYSEDGYGGQCDLIYEDPEGNVVVADLKTSSGLRHKHRLQAVAYAKAVEKADDVPVDNVDRCEVIRIHPDSQSWEVHRSDEEEWLVDPWGNFEYESVEEQWETFKALVGQIND